MRSLDESEFASPHQRYIADVVWDDCGATEHATVITIRRDAIFSDKADLLTLENTHHVRLSWIDAHTLDIRCENGNPRTVQQTNRTRDVRVPYKVSATD
jgi:hypothetical protein